ncbi:hypothetical protein ACTI_27130 [Actinoplanes sp. OR16]|uniref:hypothetical protein n=1 Tax=Actinoplanes sp. OR16 TaxID=946334 RepID=UPI000F71345D|nr:hypothetical protein [Actinoplanes sp. OR16]BBH66028.1 hypothetical protein ACTI_27130 [Actinoplanes sp. OR16]
MRYATPTRSAHALVVRPFPGPAGQHRTPRPRRQRHLRREPYQAARLLTHALAALIVLGIVVMLTVLIVADDGTPPATTPRAASGTPLTATEVFPDQATLFRVGETRVEADCPVAVTGGLRSVLQGYACSQAIRASLTVPYADYRVTAGVLTLPDVESATAVGERVRELVETGDGGFAVLSGATAAPGTPIAWRTHDRYLLYCVILSPTGELVPTDDPAVTRMMTEVLDTHLTAALTGR